MKKKMEFLKDFNPEEKEIFKKFLNNIEFDEKTVSPELSLKIIDTIEKESKKKILLILDYLKNWLYGFSFALGITIGIFIGTYFKNIDTKIELARIEEHTIKIEPIIVNLNFQDFEKNINLKIGGYNE